ncbi:MAG TPA: SEC-C metal-binding domain-containing protein [Chitinispirillaceae bacterium]|nr:SEC-C metal-binding domain-containing protein [Chitinispirillaceae bacterium]
MILPGRNDPCHCGSGKKYKKCCLSLDEEQSRTQNAIQTSQSNENIEEIPNEEDRIIEEFCNEIDNLDIKTDTSEIIAKIKVFISVHPDLIYQTAVIDTLFTIEEELHFQHRIEDYISLLEYVQKQVPDFYHDEFGWLDPARIKHAIATRNLENIGPLLTNFKNDPVTYYDNLGPIIDLLTWIGAEKELYQLIDSIHPQLCNNDEFVETTPVINWIYFKLTIEAALSSDPIDSCLCKIKKTAEKQYESINIDDIYNHKYSSEAIESIRNNIPDWNCPYDDQDRMDDFFTAMGWNLFNFIRQRTGCNYVQAKAITLQLENFWSQYLYAEVPASAVYLITSSRIKKFITDEDGICGIAFLQAVWYFAEFLSNHNKLDFKVKETLQNEVKNLYNITFRHQQEYYPAHTLIEEFPKMYCAE